MRGGQEGCGSGVGWSVSERVAALFLRSTSPQSAPGAGQPGRAQQCPDSMGIRACHPFRNCVDAQTAIDATSSETSAACRTLTAARQVEQYTGFPFRGTKGTVVRCPHSAQTTSVCARSGKPILAFRADRHFVQRAGMLISSFSRKNCCSPAVQVKGLLQSRHVSVLSRYSTNQTPSVFAPRLPPRRRITHRRDASHSSSHSANPARIPGHSTIIMYENQ